MKLHNKPIKKARLSQDAKAFERNIVGKDHLGLVKGLTYANIHHVWVPHCLPANAAYGLSFHLFYVYAQNIGNVSMQEVKVSTGVNQRTIAGNNATVFEPNRNDRAEVRTYLNIRELMRNMSHTP